MKSRDRKHIHCFKVIEIDRWIFSVLVCLAFCARVRYFYTYFNRCKINRFKVLKTHKIAFIFQWIPLLNMFLCPLCLCDWRERNGQSDKHTLQELGNYVVFQNLFNKNITIDFSSTYVNSSVVIKTETYLFHELLLEMILTIWDILTLLFIAILDKLVHNE